jgi:hypothetical protein
MEILSQVSRLVKRFFSSTFRSVMEELKDFEGTESIHKN